jgi:hypothetical protein
MLKSHPPHQTAQNKLFSGKEAENKPLSLSLLEDCQARAESESTSTFEFEQFLRVDLQHAPLTVKGHVRVIRRFLKAVDKPINQVTREDEYLINLPK